MGTSQQVSRGFHRLGLILATIPLLIGAGMVAQAYADYAKLSGSTQYQQKMCAHDYLEREGLVLTDDEMKELKPWQVPWQLYKLPKGEAVGTYNKEWLIRLKKIGCSNDEEAVITYGEARDASGWFEYATRVVGITLAISGAVYGLVRAIGWVVGGFMAS